MNTIKKETGEKPEENAYFDLFAIKAEVLEVDLLTTAIDLVKDNLENLTYTILDAFHSVLHDLNNRGLYNYSTFIMTGPIISFRLLQDAIDDTCLALGIRRAQRHFNPSFIVPNWSLFNKLFNSIQPHIRMIKQHNPNQAINLALAIRGLKAELHILSRRLEVLPNDDVLNPTPTIKRADKLDDMIKTMLPNLYPKLFY